VAEKFRRSRSAACPIRLLLSDKGRQTHSTDQLVQAPRSWTRSKIDKSKKTRRRGSNAIIATKDGEGP